MKMIHAVNQAVSMNIFLHEVISKVFLTKEEVCLCFKIVTIEERKAFDLIIFLFCSSETVPFSPVA